MYFVPSVRIKGKLVPYGFLLQLRNFSFIAKDFFKLTSRESLNFFVVNSQAGQGIIHRVGNNPQGGELSVRWGIIR